MKEDEIQSTETEGHSSQEEKDELQLHSDLEHRLDPF